MELAEFLSTELDAMLRFARVLVGDRSTAEDIVQDVITRLVARPERLTSVAYPTAYVRRMIVNEYVSWGRKWFRIKPFADLALSASSRDPAETVVEADDLRTALAGLPRNQRSVLVMRYYAGLDDDEIAGALGCSPGTVRSHASRALATLRVSLPKAEEELR